jgi:hypothetical protein
VEGRIVVGGGCFEGWEAGRQEDFGVDCDSQAGLGAFSTVSALPIGSCHEGAGAEVPAVFFRSNGRRHVFGLAGGAPI